MEDYFRVGVISTVHGIHGEVKVYPTTDDVNRYCTLKHVILDTGKEYITLDIENIKFSKKMVIIKFCGFNCIEDIEKYKGKDLLVTREDAVSLEEGEFFIKDLVGCLVITEQQEEIGELIEVLQTGANDVFIVRKKEGKELLLPYIDPCIKNIDIENKRITAYIMPGLED